MPKVKLKNEKNLNPCTKCGLLTYNGKNSLCNACNPSKNLLKVSQTPDIKDLPKIPVFKMNKPKGKQLQKYSKAYGKTVKNIEYSYGDLIISFTDNTFLQIAGDNDGDGGYVFQRISKEQEEKNDHFRWNGYECENCHYQWLPRKNNERPKRCPKCGNLKIISLVSLRFRKIEEESPEPGDKF